MSSKSDYYLFKSLGARNAAQRKLLDELGIPAEDVPVDQFTPLGRMLYKAPSDANGASTNVIILTLLIYILYIIFCPPYGVVTGLYKPFICKINI